MRIRLLGLPILAVVATLALHGESVTGNILIRTRLTPRKVTASLPVYQRGVGVELVRDSMTDPLEFERSRVVIYLEGPGPATPVKVSMQQNGRRFSPDLVVVPVGSSVSFPNMDPIFHNVFSLSKVKSFDLGNYPKGDSREVRFSKPGIVYVDCHLHPNMAGTVVVTPNQWFAKPGPDGDYRIEDVPPGNYEVVAWHKAVGFFRRKIHVDSGRTERADFFIPIGEPESLRAGTSR